MAADEELTLTQAAAFFSVTTDTLMDTLVPRYNIPYRQDKRRRFFRRSDLQRIKDEMYRRKRDG